METRQFTNVIVVALLPGWAVVIYFMLRHYRRKAERAEIEISGA